ncbi:MAG: hypothetical protein QOI16_1833 [Pseudonocardiales bacterium]|jgi:uncharacterized protein YndB with AHSA1/START domain|nr:hypothetical protein [Pseudonocardiales bacterium]
MSAESGDGLRGGSQGFACHTPATPERVWAALTDAEATSGYLYGLAAHSTWEPGAPISLDYGGRVRFTGRVLCVHPKERLSYVVQADEGAPPVYLTWLIRPTAAGCTIRLEVDEVDLADSAEGAEDVWLPVLAALQKQLAEP